MGSLSSAWLRSSGASDVDETMNKPTKNSYAATNRRIDITGPQLLSARAPAQISSNTSAENNDVTLKSYIEMQEKGVELKKTTYELSTFSVAQEDHTEQECFQDFTQTMWTAFYPRIHAKVRPSRVGELSTSLSSMQFSLG